MSGLDVASGIAGLISLSISLFNGCIQAFELVAAARHLEQDADRVRCMLDWEQYRLLQWGERVGLEGGSTVQSRQLNWTLVTDLLRQLHTQLTDANILRERYNLDVIDPNDVSLTGSRDSVSSRKGIGKLWAHVKPNLQLAHTRIVKESARAGKKLRWAALDQSKILTLLNDIGHSNNILHKMLESAEQDFVRNALSAVLRDLVSRSTLPTDMTIIKALLDMDYISGTSSIEAAASLKQLRLYLGVDRRSDEKAIPREHTSFVDSAINDNSSGSSRQTLSKLSYKQLQREETVTIGECRHEIGTYRSPKKGLHSQVLIEWKSVEKQVEARLKTRIERLTLLMSNISDPAFHSLKCLGYLGYQTPGACNMYGLIYEVVDLNHETPPFSASSLRPLSSLFGLSKAPSLTRRIRIAFALAETILQLHTSGWLHKGIRSENVIFLDRAMHVWENGSSLGPFVAGYEYARADNPLEMTEDAPSNPIADLYRHPEAQGVVRLSFKKIYDLYALGCVLLEVALWQSLEDILFDAGNVEEKPAEAAENSNLQQEAHLKWTAIIRGKQLLIEKEINASIFDKIAYHAGDKYRDAVQMCLLAGMSTQTSEDDDDESEESIQTQLDIVRVLGQCNV